ERRGIEPVLGRADPVGVDRLDVARVGLAAPTQEEALCCGVAAGDDLVRRRLAPVGHGRRPCHDLHHLRREPPEILARLLVRDLGLDGDDAFEPWLEVIHRLEIYRPQLESRAVAHEVTLIPGDGTGPELSDATRRVLEATGVELDWDVQEAGADVMEQYGGN